MQNSRTLATSAPRLSWREKVALLRAKQGTQSRLLSGSVIMLVGAGMATLLNFAYNVAVARLLGPAGFGHAAVATTLLMMVSGVTLSFQLVCAKLVARNEVPEAKAAVYQTLLRRSWQVGLALGAGLTIASGPVARYLNLPSPWMIVVLALGFAVYVPLGARRGGMQGMCAFTRLAASYVIEALLKLAGAVLLVQFGFGALGAITAISLSVICAWFIPVPAQLKTKTAWNVPASVGEAVQAIVFFVGQVIISNCDIVVVKHLFNPETAGLYAAVALVGRVVFFASWMVVIAMFPISAGAKAEEGRKTILAVPLTFVIVISGAFVALMALAPDFVLRLVFGSHFTQGQSVDGLLAMYAAMAGVYSISVVLIAYEMSRKVANAGWLQLVIAVAIVAGIFIFHATLREVVMVQLVSMAALLAVVAVFPFIRRGRRRAVLQEAA